MSRIKELLNDNTSVLVFDIDGVLAVAEWGEHTHFALSDDEWTNACKNGTDFYTEDKVSAKMQDFISRKDLDKIFVITTANSRNEGEFKRRFANKFYKIPKENVYYVENNSEKVLKLAEIKRKFPNLLDEKIIMIDDTMSILNDVMEKTKFSTAHISSFLDI